MTMPSAARSIFDFFWFAARKARRSRAVLVVCALPVLAAAVFLLRRLLAADPGVTGLRVFSDLIMSFYLQFIVLMLALFYGTSVVSEEVENKTLTYLTTRPVAKAAVILGKYGAYTVRSIVLVAAGVVASFLILNYDHLNEGDAWLVLLKSLIVLVLALIAYTAFFTFLGAFLKKSVLFGLFFCFGWENIVQYFPGTTQRLTLIHYLKSILRPETAPAGGLQSFLFFRLDPSPVGTAVLTLIGFTAIALVLAVAVFSRKEYLFEE
jgi:ABC-type transport system involved in multi-copper enzyme maturation permease subunit